MIFVSPAERPAALRALGPSAGWVEDYGVDFFWIAHSETFGVQRKDVKDLVASLHDGRLAKELAQMEQLHHPMLIVEGDWKWEKGLSKRRGLTFSRAQYVGIVCAVQYEHGLTIMETRSVQDTADTISRVASWTAKAEHGSLRYRPPAPSSPHERAVWVLQGFGLGRKTAEAILNHYGKLPLTLDTTFTELCQVPGVGPKRAATLMELFNDSEH